MPLRPAEEKGRLAAVIWPEVTVKLVAEPMTAPLELRNEMVPVQEAAVPLDDSVAAFTTLMRAVSVLPSPAGGNVKVRVLVVDDCANNDNADPAARIEVKTSFRKTILRLS